MSIRRETPCDFEPFICPYAAEYNCDCEYWCGAEEPEEPEGEEWDDEAFWGYDPREGEKIYGAVNPWDAPGMKLSDFF